MATTRSTLTAVMVHVNMIAVIVVGIGMISVWLVEGYAEWEAGMGLRGPDGPINDPFRHFVCIVMLFVVPTAYRSVLRKNSWCSRIMTRFYWLTSVVFTILATVALLDIVGDLKLIREVYYPDDQRYFPWMDDPGFFLWLGMQAVLISCVPPYAAMAAIFQAKWTAHLIEARSPSALPAS